MHTSRFFKRHTRTILKESACYSETMENTSGKSVNTVSEESKRIETNETAHLKRLNLPPCNRSDILARLQLPVTCVHVSRSPSRARY